MRSKKLMVVFVLGAVAILAIYARSSADERNYAEQIIQTVEEDAQAVARAGACSADLDCSGVVNAADILLALQCFQLSGVCGSCCSSCDTDGSGTVNVLDYLFVINCFRNSCCN